MSEQIKIPTIDVKQYGGKQVAILNGEIVASGDTSEEVLRRAQQEHPATSRSDIHLLAVPKYLHVIYHA
jgi:hypothetical protein